MLTEAIQALKDLFSNAMTNGRMPFLKTIKYGPEQSIAVNEQPCLLYNFEGIDKVVTGQRFPELTLSFSVLILTGVMDTEERCAMEAQKVFWDYTGVNSKHDVGLLPFLLENQQKIVLHDTMGRDWILLYSPKIKIYSQQQGTNSRGAVYANLLLTTRVDRLK
jgi:hypothetical protein